MGGPILQAQNPYKKVREILKETADLGINKPVDGENR